MDTGYWIFPELLERSTQQDQVPLSGSLPSLLADKSLKPVLTFFRQEMIVQIIQGDLFIQDQPRSFKGSHPL